MDSFTVKSFKKKNKSFSSHIAMLKYLKCLKRDFEKSNFNNITHTVNVPTHLCLN